MTKSPICLSFFCVSGITYSADDDAASLIHLGRKIVVYPRHLRNHILTSHSTDRVRVEGEASHIEYKRCYLSLLCLLLHTLSLLFLSILQQLQIKRTGLL